MAVVCARARIGQIGQHLHQTGNLADAVLEHPGAAARCCASRNPWISVDLAVATVLRVADQLDPPDDAER